MSTELKKLRMQLVALWAAFAFFITLSAAAFAGGFYLIFNVDAADSDQPSLAVWAGFAIWTLISLPLAFVSLACVAGVRDVSKEIRLLPSTAGHYETP